MPSDSTAGRLGRVASRGNRRATLVSLRNKLAEAIDECESARDLPGLSRQLADVLEQIDAIPNKAEVSAADEIAARRASRRSSSAGSARS